VVAVDDQTTMRALIDPHRQRHRLAMGTSRTGLARVGRVHSHDVPPSFFRFGLQVCEEHRPRDICDTFGQPRVFEHIPHDQRFHRQQSKTLDELTDFLLDEVFATVPYPLMDACYHLALVCSLFAPCGGFGQFTLGTSERGLLSAEKARIGNLFPSRKIRERFQPHINPYRFLRRRQLTNSGFFFIHLDTDGDIPFPCGRLFNNCRFRRPFDALI